MFFKQTCSLLQFSSNSALVFCALCNWSVVQQCQPIWDSSCNTLHVISITYFAVKMFVTTTSAMLKDRNIFGQLKCLSSWSWSMIISTFWKVWHNFPDHTWYWSVMYNRKKLLWAVSKESHQTNGRTQTDTQMYKTYIYSTIPRSSP